MLYGRDESAMNLRASGFKKWDHAEEAAGIPTPKLVPQQYRQVAKLSSSGSFKNNVDSSLGRYLGRTNLTSLGHSYQANYNEIIWPDVPYAAPPKGGPVAKHRSQDWTGPVF
jgi:hypothetical protein